MRKLIAIGTALAVAGGLLLAGFALISKLTARTETYQEMQARLAQEAANADFWRSIVWIGVALAFLAAIPLIVWLWLVALGPAHRRAMERARFDRDYNVLAFDQLGNGPVIYDRENMQLITTEQGNSPVPVTFVHGLQPSQLQAPGGKSKGKDLAVYANKQPTAYYRQEQSSSLRAIEMKQETITEYQPGAQSVVIEPAEISEISPEVEANEISDGEISQDLDNLRPQLEAAIRRGEPRTTTFRLLGVSGTSYQSVAQFYDKLFQQITGKPYKRGAGGR